MAKSKTLLALCLALAMPAAAIELSLEENKAERGNIGYIDMQRLFRAFPETIRARENFEELVRQAEEQLNLRKTEILRARSDLAELKIEREFMAKTPIEVARPPKPSGVSATPEKAGYVEAPKGAAATLAAATAVAKESKDRENPELAKLLETPRSAPSTAAPAPATAVSVPVPPAANPAPAAAATAPVAPNSALAAASGSVPPPVAQVPVAQAPAAGAGRRGAEPETDLTRPSIANLPGFGAIPASSAPAQGFAPTPPPAPAPAAVPYATPQQLGSVSPAPAAVPAPASDENLREALEQSRKAAEAKKREPLVINIPGVSTAPIVVQPPASLAPAASTAPAQVQLPVPLPAAGAATVAAATVAASTSAVKAAETALNPALVELDAKIAVKARELQAKEFEFKEQQASSEKNLLDLESRKTEILLGKIHRAVQEVAHREGVSVVVDKSSILFGHDAVDLTEKVMKYLKGI